MVLDLIKDIIAVQDTSAIADADREFTKEGIEKMKRATAGMRAAEASQEVTLSSPLSEPDRPPRS